MYLYIEWNFFYILQSSHNIEFSEGHTRALGQTMPFWPSQKDLFS